MDDTPGPVESLSTQTTRAAKWRLASSIIGAASQVGIGIVLARLLLPADFGLMALAFVVLGAAQGFGDLGIAGAVVQRKDITVRHLRTAFTFSIALGVIVAAFVAAIAPIGAALVEEPRVTSIVRWLSLTFAIQGAAVVSRALLRRRLDYKGQFVIDTFSYLAGYACVTIVLAAMGHGVWSLVWGGIAQAVFLTIGSLAYAYVDMRPLLARSELRDLLNFGVGMSLGAWVNYLARNGDNLVVGRYLGPEALGFYGRAYSLMTLPFTHFARVMSAVLFPALSQVQDDPARVRRAYLMMTRLTAAVSAPVMGTMAIAAPHLIVGIYGARWQGTVLPLQIFCVFGYCRALYHIGGVVAQSAGRVYDDLRNQIIYAVFVLAGSAIGVLYGTAGVAVGVGVAIVVMFVATGQLALRVTGTSWRTYLGEQIAPLVIGVVTTGIALGTRMLLETSGASTMTIALAVPAIAAAAAVCGMLWILSEVAFQPLLANLPPLVTRCVGSMHHVRRRAQVLAAAQPRG